MRRIWNDGWEFNLNDSPEELKNDDWESVRLPHDWLISDTTDLYRDGYGRYRKVFDVDADRIRSSVAHVFIVFDGVYMDSAYYLNGEQIGEWKYGYSQYVLELPADKLIQGRNELMVGVNFISPNSRWYSGAGISRDVTYVETPAVYIPENGVYIHTQETEDGYLLYVDTEICGSAHPADEAVQTSLYDEDGEPVGLVPADAEKAGRALNNPFTEPASSQVFFVPDPHLWSVDDPYLYAVEQVLGGRRTVYGIGFMSAVCDVNNVYSFKGRRMKR
jgi:beta-galactosidase